MIITLINLFFQSAFEMNTWYTIMNYPKIIIYLHNRDEDLVHEK